MFDSDKVAREIYGLIDNNVRVLRLCKVRRVEIYHFDSNIRNASSITP